MTDFQRRASDEMLREILKGQQDVIKTVSDFRIAHAELHGQLNVRVEELEKKTQFVTERVSLHEKWINTATGRVSGVAVIFGSIGSFIGWFIDHVFFHKA